MADLVQRLLRWPLWSWRNLSITVAIGLISLAVIGRVSAMLRIDEPSASDLRTLAVDLNPPRPEAADG